MLNQTHFNLAAKQIMQDITKIVFVFVFFAGCCSCHTNPKKMEALSKEFEEPIASSIDLNCFYTKNGEVSHTLSSPKVERFSGDKPYIEFSEGLEIYSFEKKEVQSSYFKANYAVQKLSDKLIIARGGVFLKNSKNETLETEHLVWDEQKEQIYTQELVKITKEGQTIIGEGFESDIYFSKYTLKKSRGIITFEEDE